MIQAAIDWFHGRRPPGAGAARAGREKRNLKRWTIRKFKHGVIFLIKAVITAALLAAFLYTTVRYYPQTDFHFWGFVVFAVLYLAVFLLLASLYRCLSIGIIRLRELVPSLLIAVFLANCIIYLVLSLTAKALLPLLPLLLMQLAQWCAGSLLLLLGNRLYYRLRAVRDAALVIGGESDEAQVLRQFEAVRERYRISAVLHADEEDAEALFEQLAPYSTVIVGGISARLRLRLMDHCFERNKRLFVIPTVQDILFHSAQETFVGDSLVYLCRNRAMNIEELAVKRLMDIVLSLAGILVTSPLMLAAAIAIKAHDGGPVLFRQQRYTRNCERFTLVKFRSMVVDAEPDGAQLTVEHDPRVTPVGRILRRTRIDELPQFFNILRGEMSLVGPRAERIENVDYYCRCMPEFRYRMKVKAGLTGYAQIFGRYNTSYEEKLKMDLLYIENYSPFLDLQLLLLTARALLLPSSTQGFDRRRLGADAPEAGRDAAGYGCCADGADAHEGGRVCGADGADAHEGGRGCCADGADAREGGRVCCADGADVREGGRGCCCADGADAREGGPC